MAKRVVTVAKMNEARRIVATLALLLTPAAVSCGSEAASSTTTIEAPAAENDSPAPDDACEHLEYIRDNWSIDSPRPGWPQDVSEAVDSAADSLPDEQAQTLRTATGSLTSMTNPSAPPLDIESEGAAQQQVDQFTAALCGFEVF